MTRRYYCVEDSGSIEELAEATGRISRAEVIRDAISVYQLLVKKAKDGERIYLGSDRDNAAECIITTLEPIRVVAEAYKRRS